MGDHECPLLLETEGSSPASPTEPGDSELEDGQTPWGQEIPLHIPTPARRSSARRHEHDLSPFGGTDSTGDGPTLCMMCCHEGKSVGCQACGHVACSACTEATDIGGGHWQWLCPCCRDSTVQSPDRMHTMCPTDDRCNRTESPCMTSPPSRDKSEDVMRQTDALWPSHTDLSLLEAIHKMEADMHPARFYGLFKDEEDCKMWAREEGVDELHAVRTWTWAANMVFIRDKVRDKAIREDKFKIPPPSGDLQLACPAPLVHKRIMPVALTSTTSREIHVARACRKGSSKEDKQLAKLQSHKEFMYDLYMAAGPRGQHWMESHNEEEMEERREVILSKLDKFTDPGALSGKKSNWRRWEQWAKEKGICPFEARELEVAQYIRKRGRGGHTAANGVFQALAFLESYVGVRLHTDKQNIISMGERKPRAEGVPSKQAEIATPSIYLRVYDFCKQKSDAGEGGTVVVLGMLILAWMVACIRAKHAQTSWITKITARFIHWWCPEGKRRVQGVRVPFAWIIPRVLGPGLDVWPHLDRVYTALKDGGDAKLPFFIPDVDVVGWQDLNADTPWISRAMPYDKMSKMFRGMCVAVGVAADWAAMMTTYTPRRFGPTACGAMGYDEEQMQALSSWQEIPQHQDKKPGSRARFVMSRHYDGSTDLMSGDLKGVMIVALHYAFGTPEQPPKGAIEQNHLDEELKILRKVKAGGIPDQLEQEWMSARWEIGKDEETTESIAITVKAKYEFSWGQTTESKPTEGSEAEEGLSEGPDSSSESSGEEPGEAEDEELDLKTGWFVQTQGGPTHFVWSQSSSGLPVPFCRKPSGAPFNRSPYMCGTCVKLDDLAGATKGAHLPCLMLAPPAVQAAWRKFAGDDIVHPDISD